MDPFTQVPTFRRYQVHRDLAILVVVVVACAAPFLSQPFHMDDNFYMDMARNARLNPLYPNDTPYVFDGQPVPDMGSHSHPPLQTYFLALLQVCFGEGAGKEWLYHLSALVFPILAVLALYFLASGFLERPLWPSLALGCSPLFLVMQHNLMADMSTLAFWLAAVASFFWAANLRSRMLYTWSALFQFAAMFASYQAAAITPLLAFHQLRRRNSVAGWVCLAAPWAAMSAWIVLNVVHYHRFLFLDTLGYIQSRNAVSLAVLGSKLFAILEYQGWLIVFPLFFIYALGGALKGRFLALTGLLSAYTTQILVPEYRLSDRILFFLGLVTGILVVFHMVVLARQSFGREGKATGFGRSEGQFLSLWYFGVFAYSLLLFTEGSARYILPLVPPVLIGFFRHLEIREVAEYRMPVRPLLSTAMLASGSLVISLTWGLLLSHADLELARVYPRAASEVARIAGTSKSFFLGEWGLRYYFTQAGMRMLPVDDSQVRGGSFIASPRLALPRELPSPLHSMTMPLQTLRYEVKTPLRTLDWATPAGFYSTGWGLIPFSLSSRAVEEIEIQQVNFLVERLPWAKTETLGKTAPWPGYLAIEGKSPLALLAKPGSRVSYTWTTAEPIRLDLLCGVEPGRYVEGAATEFAFLICARDASTRILVKTEKILKPGTRIEDRGWNAVSLLMPGAVTGQRTLELTFDCNDASVRAIGAFAEAVLRPVR